MTALPYRQQLSFSYDATTHNFATYPSGSVTTGTPVFEKIVPSVTLHAHYHLSSSDAALAKGSGTIRLLVELVGSDGRSRPLSSVGPTQFHGSSTTVSVPVNLHEAAAVLNAVNKQSAVGVGVASIAAHPRVKEHGTLDGLVLSSTFRPDLVFSFAGNELSLPAAAPSSTATPGATGSSVLSPAKSAPSSLHVLGRSFSLAAARRTSEFGLLFALLAGVLASLVALAARRANEPARIRSRYGRSIVEATGGLPSAASEVEIVSMAAPARLAEANGALILHFEDDDGHVYVVEGPSGRYGYHPDRTPRATDDPAPLDGRFLTEVG